MSKGKKIHVVQVQDSHGHWDIHGVAFLNEETCRAFVDDGDIEWIMEEVPYDVIVEAILDIPKEDFEARDLGLEDRRKVIDAELRKVDRQKILDFFDSHEMGQIGGVYSWETVEIKDA